MRRQRTRARRLGAKALKGAAAALAALFGLWGAAAGAAAPGLEAAWVQLTGGDRAEVRAVVAGPACPEGLADGRRLVLEERTGPTAGFPGRVCAAALPKGVRALELGGRALPVPRERVDKIVVMGDSGCRLRGLNVQNCNDPKAWPFAAVAAAAAAERPDLFIHLGDYYYRETACPLNWSGCADSAFGDAWPTWAEDFFTPAAPLLAAAPALFVRGNHEECGRGAEGWFRLLDAAQRPKSCPADADPFTVSIGGLDLHVLDSALTVDRAAPPARTAAFRRDLVAALGRGEAPSWILTHRPIWGLVPVARLGPIGPLNLAINATEQAAVRGLALKGVDLVLSGHIHHFQSLSFGPERPPQLIVGTGGDVGESADSRAPETSEVEIDAMSARRLEFDRFGYFVFERAAEGWRGRFVDAAGRVRARCVLKTRDLSCVWAGSR